MEDTLILAIESSCDEDGGFCCKKRKDGIVKCDLFPD